MGLHRAGADMLARERTPPDETRATRITREPSPRLRGRFGSDALTGEAGASGRGLAALSGLTLASP